MFKANDPKETKKKPIDRESHPIYKDEDVQQTIGYNRRKIFPRMDQNTVKKLEEKIKETLDAMARLYDAATKSEDSKRLFNIIREQHLNEENFLEKGVKDKESLPSLKSLYIDAHEVEINEESNKQIYGSDGNKFVNCLDRISFKAIKCIETETRIPKIGTRSVNSISDVNRDASKSAGSSPTNAKAQGLHEEKESSATK